METSANHDSLVDGPLRSPDELIDRYGDEEPGDGDLLEEQDEAKVAKKVLRLWTAQDEIWSRHLAQVRANELRKRGVPNVAVRKEAEDWRAWFPSSASPDKAPIVNKAATLCRRTGAVLLADPPIADPVPPSGEDSDEAATEMMGRILEEIQGENGLNEQLKIRQSWSRGDTGGSGFVCYWIDPRGGGRQPIEIQAGFDPTSGDRATSVEDALQRPVMQPPPVDPVTGAPAVDPVTGAPMGPQPVLQESGEPVTQPWPDFETRFVRADGTLTDKKGEAARRWVPGLRSEVVSGKNVRPIPHTAEDIWEAEGAMIGSFMAWGEVKSIFPKLADLPKEEVDKILSFRPEKHDDLLGPGDRRALEDSESRDERLCFVLRLWFDGRRCPKYPNGAYVVVVGGKHLAFRGTWIDESEEGDQELLAIPITQYKQWSNDRGTFYGDGGMDFFGMANEVRIAQYSTWLDYLDRFNNRKIFLPTNSIVQPRQLQQTQATTIPINPGGKPEYEDIPAYPRDSSEILDRTSGDMDDASMLQNIGQGLEDKSVQSGRHAYAIISQVHAGLSEPKANIERGFIRGCRITAQLVRAYYTVPRQVHWTGDDGAFRQEAWSGADLHGMTDVRIRTGTMTMLSPAAKAQLAEHYAKLGVLAPDELRDIISSNLGGTIGIQDDPARLRIRRQISRWSKGAPEDAELPEPVQQQAVDPMGMPIMQTVQPPAPLAAAIFSPVPSDSLPGVAQIRLTEIARLMASTKYDKQQPAWKAAIDQEFYRMQQAAAPPMLPPGAPQGGGGPPRGLGTEQPGEAELSGAAV